MFFVQNKYTFIFNKYSVDTIQINIEIGNLGYTFFCSLV